MWPYFDDKCQRLFPNGVSRVLNIHLIQAGAGMWASCIRLVNPIDGRTVQVGAEIIIFLYVWQWNKLTGHKFSDFIKITFRLFWGFFFPIFHSLSYCASWFEYLRVKWNCRYIFSLYSILAYRWNLCRWSTWTRTTRPWASPSASSPTWTPPPHSAWSE